MLTKSEVNILLIKGYVLKNHSAMNASREEGFVDAVEKEVERLIFLLPEDHRWRNES